MRLIQTIKESVLHLFFPHLCAGCGTDVIAGTEWLCLSCVAQLPETRFQLHRENPVDKLFWGRIALHQATAQYYFTKQSLMQALLHQFKYKGGQELGRWLGRLMASHIRRSPFFQEIDVLVPLPLHRSRQRQRGYNQAEILCNGMSEVLGKPVLHHTVIRKEATESQTRKNRLERWENMQDRFELVDAASIEGLHVLLVDDVITTGATLEACGKELLKAPNVTLSIAALCFASGS